VLLVSDEVICGFGRLGSWFGAERYRYQPDLLTFAKGVTSGYAPLAGVLCRDFLAEPFLQGDASFAHGITFGGHPVSCAVALANLDVLEGEGIIDHVGAMGPSFGARLEGLRDLPIVGDVRGDGFFWAVELVKDPDDPGVRFTPEERIALMRGTVGPGLFARGLVCRADDRVDPVVQLSPVLVCGEDELDEIEATLRTVLSEAGAHLTRS